MLVYKCDACGKTLADRKDAPTLTVGFDADTARSQTLQARPCTIMTKKATLEGLATLISKGFASADGKFMALAEDIVDIKTEPTSPLSTFEQVLYYLQYLFPDGQTEPREEDMHGRSIVSVFALTVGLLVSSMQSSARAAEITLLCAAALESWMHDVIPEFERTSGYDVKLTFGIINVITERVRKGDAADLAIVSPQQWEDLSKERKLDPSVRTVIAKVGYGVFVKKGAAKPDIRSVEVLKRALLDASSIALFNPSGRGPTAIYVAHLFDRLGISEDLKPKAKYPTRQNGRHERMHRTLKAQTSDPPAANAGAQQVRFDDFRRHYNEERPPAVSSLGGFGCRPPEPAAPSVAAGIRNPSHNQTLRPARTNSRQSPASHFCRRSRGRVETISAAAACRSAKCCRTMCSMV